ncbi:CheR family methyltransferase [Paracoccus albicereus]|nr:CheR family methyltransferase [Paracoccus albicereus]
MRRMQVTRNTSISAYADYLVENPEEAQELFSDLLISVTSFFRDPQAYEILAREGISSLFDNVGDEGIRAWVAGCATREEAYSLAILLLEEASRRKDFVPIQIFATDLDEGALGTARQGRYPASIEVDVSEDRLRQYFVKEGLHYRIKKEVCDIVLFASHSVIKDPPFMRLDLIFCRNLMIYMERQLQREVCALFAYGLTPGGLLFLGSAETTDATPDLFSPINREARLYRARTQASRKIPLMSRMPVEHRLTEVEQPYREQRQQRDRSIGAVHIDTLEKTSPPSILVDRAGQALHLSQNAARFLLASAGPVSSDLADLVRTELRLDLRSALRAALDQGQPTLTSPISVLLDGSHRRVVMHVAPVIQAADQPPSHAIVLFMDGGAALEADQPPEGSEGQGEVNRLRQDLVALESRLAASRSENETAIQDLRVANEELQSINEEYRSTSEELETFKEELQSMNEELKTVNSELKTKLESIGAANSDLENIVAATDIGTLFLDQKLRIRMFTPRVADVFNVTEPDVGRSITDFTHRLDYRGLADDALAVLRNLAPIEREAQSEDGRWLMMRLRPYRTVEDRIEGVVVIFIDVTAQHQADQRLRISEERFRALTHATADAIFRMTPDWTEMRELIGGGFLADVTATLSNWEDRYILVEDQPGIRSEIDTAIQSKQPFEMEHRVRRADGSTGWAHSRAVPMLGRDGEIVEWFGTASDITRQKCAEAARRESDNRYRALFDTIREGFCICERLPGEPIDFRYLAANPAFLRQVGCDDPTGMTMRQLVPGVEDSIMERYRIVADTGEPQSMTVHVAVMDRWYEIEATAAPLPEHIAVLFRDVTQRIKADEALAQSEGRTRALIEGVPQLIWRAVGKGYWTWASPQWVAFTGQAEADSHGEGWLDMVHPDDRGAAETAWQEASDRSAFRADYRIFNAHEGRYRWFQTRATAVRDDNGEIVEWLGTSTDVDDLRQMQERQQVLVAELQHRTRNLLAVVRSMTDKFARSSKDLEEFRERFGDRLEALSRVQGLLSRLDDADRVTFDELIRTELAALDGSANEVEIDGPSGVRLRSSSVQTLALAIHELATNAVKYGALSQPDARLRISWHVEQASTSGQPWLHIDWHERGVVLDKELSGKIGAGHGRELIEKALPYQLNAKTTYELLPDGVHCTIAIRASSTVQEDVSHD